MQIEFNYTPFPVHLPFHQTHAREKAAIGAVGSGKTIALCADAILLGLQQPGSRILIARNTVPSLRDTTEHEFLSLMNSIPEAKEGIQKKTLYDISDISRAGGHTDRITLPNGTEFYFRSLDDWRKLMSFNLCAFYIDEASEVSPESYLGLLTRIRQVQPTEAARRMGYKEIRRQIAAICTNPNGHDWIWEYFVHNPKSMRESGDPEQQAKALNRRYFRSTSFDNPTLYDADGQPGQYLKSLLTMPEVWVKRYVMCEFDAFEGQIYPFSPTEHVYDHFEPGTDWDRACGLDWGIRNPTAVVWWARKPGTQVWHVYREWQTYDPTDPYQRETYVTTNVHQIAERIKQLEAGEVIKYRVADPAIKQSSQTTGQSVQYFLHQHGLYFQPGMKRYEDRINALNQLLTSGQFVVSSACPMTQIALQQYRWADLATNRDSDGPERPLKKNDHLVNANEYLATLFVRESVPVEARVIPAVHEEIWGTIRKQVTKQGRMMQRGRVL